MKNEKGILIAKIKFKKPIKVKNGDHFEMNFSISLERKEGKIVSVKKLNKTNK